MKGLRLKTALVFVLFISVLHLAWSILPDIYMNVTPEQHKEIIDFILPVVLGLTVLGALSFDLYTKDIVLKYHRISELTDEELISISKKSLNLNIILAIIFAIFYSLGLIIFYFFYKQHYGNLATDCVWAGGVPGLFADPFLVYGTISLLYSKVNRDFSAELNKRGLKSKGKFVKIKYKLLFVFGGTVVGMSIWVGFYGFYAAIQQTIEETKSSRPVGLAFIAQNISKDDSISSIINKLNLLELPSNETFLLLDSEGNIVSKYDESSIFERKKHNLQSIIKKYYKEGKSFYDNINQNVYSFCRLNDRYILAQVTNINGDFSRMSMVWVWLVFFILFGFIIVAINSITLAEWINKSTENLRNLFEKLAHNDFSEDATKDSEDELAEVSEKYNEFIIHIRELIETIQVSSEAVLNAGTQLNSVSQIISENAVEQASTAEEISSNMEEMLATVNSNTEQSEKTSEISNLSAQRLEKNKELIMKSLNSIADINEKIFIISEIAEKTDILSINAAIEAAKAGETGKGFAVVAQEIRKLADNTKKASKDITSLSERNIEISQIAGKELEEVIPEILKSAELISKIFYASKEQLASISSINNAIIQFSETTNQNSATAEEMASSAEELTAQAEQLKDIIAVFKIRKTEENGKNI